MSRLHPISMISLAVLVTWIVPLACSSQQKSDSTQVHKAAGHAPSVGNLVFGDGKPRVFWWRTAPITPAWTAGQEAYKLFVNGQFREALEKCKLSSELSPIDKDGLKQVDDIAEMVAGYCLVELGDDVGALNCLLWHRPASTHFLPLYAAVAFARLGYIDTANALVEQYALETQPKSISELWKAQPTGDPGTRAVARCRHYIGDFASAQGQNKLALHNYERARELEPNNPLIAFDLGNAYSQLGRKKEARAAYTLAVNTGNRDLSLLAADRLSFVHGD